MKLRLPKMARGVLIVVLLLFMITSAFMTVKALNPHEVNMKIPQFSYNQQANVSYRAYLLPNSLYTEKTIGPEAVYISTLVDYINTYFTYEFRGERPVTVKGDYELKVMVEASVTDKEIKKVLWQRAFPLIQKTAFSGNDSLIKVERELPLRLNEYNDFARKIIDETKFTPEAIRMVAMWTVNIEAQTGAGIIKDQVTPSLVIPLGARYFEVTGELNQSKPGAIETTAMMIPPVDQKVATLYGVLMVVSMAMLAGVSFLTTEQKDLNPEQMKLKQILKTHADRLVAIDREIRATSEQMMPVKSMDDLIRTADELGRPIIYEGKGSAAASFYVMDEKTIFTYQFGESRTSSYAYSPADSPAPSRVLRRSVTRSDRPSAGV